VIKELGKEAKKNKKALGVKKTKKRSCGGQGGDIAKKGGVQTHFTHTKERVYRVRGLARWIEKK